MAMREWLETTGGKIAVALLLLAAAAAGVWAVRSTFGTSSAVTENGLLHVDLVREVPEALKPRKIEIAKGRAVEAKAAA